MESKKTCSNCALSYFSWQFLHNVCSRHQALVHFPRKLAEHCKTFREDKHNREEAFLWLERFSWPRPFLPEVYHYREL